MLRSQDTGSPFCLHWYNSGSSFITKDNVPLVSGFSAKKKKRGDKHLRWLHNYKQLLGKIGVFVRLSHRLHSFHRALASVLFIFCLNPLTKHHQSHYANWRSNIIFNFEALYYKAPCNRHMTNSLLQHCTKTYFLDMSYSTIDMPIYTSIHFCEPPILYRVIGGALCERQSASLSHRQKSHWHLHSHL